MPSGQNNTTYDFTQKLNAKDTMLSIIPKEIVNIEKQITQIKKVK